MFRQMDVNKNGVRRAVIRILLSLLIRKDSNSNCIQVILYTEFLAATLEMRGVIEEKRLAEAFDHIDDDVSLLDFACLFGPLLQLTRIIEPCRTRDTYQRR